jgi:hypothetical protein
MSGVDALYTMMQESGTAGLQAVAKDFNTCTPMNTTDDQWVFLSNVMGDLQVCVYTYVLIDCVCVICTIVQIMVIMYTV